MKKQTDPNIKAHLLRSAFYLLLPARYCDRSSYSNRSRTSHSDSDCHSNSNSDCHCDAHTDAHATPHAQTLDPEDIQL